jgi:1-acyl-sn-glycerol-3-phosphate acyltransferase
MPVFKSVWRGVRVVEHLLTGSLIAAYVALSSALGRRPSWTPAVVRWWHGRLCRALALDIRVAGKPADKALLVANHVSWLDIPALGAQIELDFLSKAEVRAWPLIGWLSEIAGTLFIARGAHQSAATAAQIGERIRLGHPVMVFPEGTTTDGTRLRRFHPRLFAAAQQDGLMVQPVALRYGNGPEPDPAAPFVGNDALLPHLLRVLRHPGLQVRIELLEAIDGCILDRRGLADYCHRRIAEALEIDASTRMRAEPPGVALAEEPEPGLLRGREKDFEGGELSSPSA